MDNDKASEIVAANKILDSSKMERYNALDVMAKNMFDLYKHLTTLSSASFILIVTFLKDLFNNPVHIWIVYLTFGLLAVSLFTSLSSMFFLTGTPSFRFNKSKLIHQTLNAISILGPVAMFSFIAAMGALAIFFVSNYMAIRP